jgi:hypothetical protein
MQPMFGQHTSLVLITPDARGTWVESLVPLLRRGVIPTVLLLDPSSFGGAGDLTATQALLTHLGVVHYVINRDLLDRPKPYPVQRARWRAPTRQTRDMAWKLL